MSNAKRVAFPGFLVALFALALAPALVSPGPVVAQTPQVATLYGSGLQEGDEVAALIDGVVCETHTVSAEDNGWWDVAIEAGPVIRVGPCGGVAVEGAVINITVNGEKADQYVTWTAGYTPPDRLNGIALTFGGSSVSADPKDPPPTATLSRTQGLAIFSGGSLDELEAAALYACPGGVTIWANEPSGEGYLPFAPHAISILSAAFRNVYADGFDGPEPVIVTQCRQEAGS